MRNQYDGKARQIARRAASKLHLAEDRKLKKIVIYNDTKRGFGRVHFGSVLAMAGMETVLSRSEQIPIQTLGKPKPDYIDGRRPFEIIGTVPLDEARAYKWDRELLNEADLVVVNGEGSFHHNNRPDIVDLSAEFPTALINTVYQANPYTYSQLARFKYISVRESRSAAEIERVGIEADIVPDTFLAAPLLAAHKPSDDGTSIEVMHFSGVRTLQEPGPVLEAIAAASYVYTESFHAILAATYYGKMITAAPSNTHKNEAVLEDIRAAGTPENYLNFAADGHHRLLDELRICI